jgi:hypothetical protein
MMTVQELLRLFDTSKRRCRLIGSAAAGAIAGLDLEGRLYTVLEGQVLNRVNPEAFLGTCTRARYLNPGGDGLWASPEGSRLGYEYSTGAWRVPPGLSSARFWLTTTTPDSATFRAEIDLINAQGLGIPTAFERQVRVRPGRRSVTLETVEAIEYLGPAAHHRETLLLAPWTLCQFDCGEGAEARFPDGGPGCVWDLYGPSDELRQCREGLWQVKTAGGPKFQLGIAPQVGYVEFVDPCRGLSVRRTTAPLAAGLDFTDLGDRPPQHEPDGPPVRFSVYNDPTCFMEIEAAGGCPRIVEPGARLELAVTTTFSLLGKP